MILKNIKTAVIVFMFALVSVVSVSSVLAQSTSPEPSNTMAPSTAPSNVSPTVMVPKEAPSTGRGL